MRPIVLILTFLTGASGLIFEVVWQRYLANLFGSHAKASVLVLAVFLGGLGLGYAAFGRISRSRAAGALMRAYGAIELGIAVWAFAFPSLYALIWEAHAFRAAVASFGIAGDVLLAVLLIGPPTILMGGTLPLLTRSLARGRHDAANLHARVYALNTAGACLGALGAGFALIPAFGLPLTIMGVAAINAVAGLFFLSVARHVEDVPEIAVAAFAPHAAPQMGKARAGILAFLGGAVSIALQTVVIRVVGLSVGSSEYAFAMVVSVFILMLAAGAAIRSTAPTALFWNQGLVLIGLFALYLSVPLWPYVAHLTRWTFATNEIAFYVYHAALFGLLTLILAVPVGALGRSMPLLFGASLGRVGDSGADVGRLYGCNTLGCIAGATLGGYVGLLHADLDVILRAAIVGAAAGAVLMPPRRTWRRLGVPVLAVAAALLAVFALPSWPRERMGLGLFRATDFMPGYADGAESLYRERNRNLAFVFYRDDPNTTVAVTESRNTDPTQAPPRSIVVNGKSDGSTQGSDLYTTTLLGMIPALFQSSGSRRAAVVGFGTGITVGALTQHDWVEAVDVIEIADAVREASPIFDDANHGVSKSPKVRWHIDDGYRFLAAAKESYGVIVSEPSNPWVTGVERLYTREFYELMRDRLAEGGVFSQWFHTYGVSPETVGLVLNTFAAVFPEIHTFYTSASDILLLGSMQAIDAAAVAVAQTRFLTPGIKRTFDELQIQTLEMLLGFELWLPPAAFAGYGTQLLEFPKLSHRAGKEFFLNRFTEAQRVSEGTTIRPFAREAASRTLLYRSLGSDPRRLQAGLAAALPAICNRKAAEITSELTGLPWQCRTAAMALAAHATLESKTEPKNDGLGPIRWLMGDAAGTPPPAVATVRSATRYIDAFADFESAILPLSSARLAEAAAPCLGAVREATKDCRAKYVIALALSGRATEAKTSLDLFVASARAQGIEIPPPMLDAMQAATYAAHAAATHRAATTVAR